MKIRDLKLNIDSLEQTNQMKEGFLKERKQFFSKTYANRALSEMEQKFAVEKEYMLLEIEKLEDELKYTK